MYLPIIMGAKQDGDLIIRMVIRKGDNPTGVSKIRSKCMRERRIEGKCERERKR